MASLHCRRVEWPTSGMLMSPFISRINLSPFTKDYRGGGQLNEPIGNFWRPTFRWATLNTKIEAHYKLQWSNYAILHDLLCKDIDMQSLKLARSGKNNLTLLSQSDKYKTHKS